MPSSACAMPARTNREITAIGAGFLWRYTSVVELDRDLGLRDLRETEDGEVPRRGYLQVDWDYDQVGHLGFPNDELKVALPRNLLNGFCKIQPLMDIGDRLKRDKIFPGKDDYVPAINLIMRHAPPNAMVPTVTGIGFRAAAAIGLTTAVEIVFGIRGMGGLLVTSIVQRNVTVLQGGMIVVGLVVAVVNLLVDISYGFLNPKVRLER